MDGNIDGLVHLSDISWDETGEEAVREYKKGDEIETVILSIDSERERISLGVKQLGEDPFASFTSEYERGSIVKGTVTEVDAKGATVLSQRASKDIFAALSWDVRRSRTFVLY